MKQVLFALSMLCLGASSTFTPVQAMSAKITKTALSLGVAFGPIVKKIYNKWPEIKEPMEEQKQFKPVKPVVVEPVFVEGQALCDQIGKKMGLGNTHIGCFLSDSCRVETYPDLSPKDNTFNYKIVVGRLYSEAPKEELKFLLAHELGHIKHNDSKNKVKFLLASLGVKGFGAVLAVKSILNSGTPVLAKGAAIAGYYFCSNLLVESLENCISRRAEKRADLTAVRALGSKESAIASFNRAREYNLSLVRKVKEGLVENKSTIQAIEAGAIDEQGNDLLDRMHPLLTERIAYCESYPL